jgi:restriction system protein
MTPFGKIRTKPPSSVVNQRACLFDNINSSQRSKPSALPFRIQGIGQPPNRREHSPWAAFVRSRCQWRGTNVERSSALQFKGWLGEFKTVLAKKVFLRSRDYVDVNDVTIETNRGTTQIDHVIISRYGVFVVETKNMSGWIFGNENCPYWTKTNWGKKFQFPNPLNQNKSHIRALSNLTKVPPEKMHSVVVFWGNCDLRTKMPPNVLHGGYVRYIKNKREVLFADEEVKAIETTIRAGMLPRTRATRLQHLSQLRQRFESTTTCAVCGSPLVLRTARSGNSAGKQFLGCSRYPSCRYNRQT